MIKADSITVRCQPANVPGIGFDYCGQHLYLTGFAATLYRGLIWMDGPEAAAKEFWELTHTAKTATAPQQIAAQTAL